MKRLHMAALCLGLCAMAGALSATVRTANGTDEEGKRLYRADCAGCHKWHGNGGGGYGGAALSLRKTQLNRAQIIMTIECGRPGTGMRYHLRDAYTPEHPCYGMSSKADLGPNAPLEADNFLRPPEIAAVTDYVLADIKGHGDPSLAECRSFFGPESHVCDVYGKTPAQGGGDAK